ncbi:granulin a isoform X3 [Epinephelus moara]|uniref:granulin a isoform X3 n=1 Tax=Epinephelus moara TaxID=300413 RepID=UPI00214E90A7|nr:granulin a isoform X3 [Epinephelus moara]
MQRWVVICCALLALVGADECPDGGRCKDGQTCCYDPANGYECCPFAQAECCGDHMHCCPAGTVCDTATSSCLNSTGSIPWVERVSADQPRHSKSFRMIKTHMGEDDDKICPDWSRCPPEFSCLKALTRFGCCPLAQGVPCSDGKHCCPEGHQCSADSRSCIEKELVTTVLCSDGISECPDETTCCETPEGKWGCCPLPKAVCCDDKTHCCPEDSTCDVEQSKCISLSTKKQTPMWAKLPARIRADWENQKEGETVTAEIAVDGGSEKTPKVTTVNEVPPSQKEVFVSSTTKAAAGNDIPCDDTVACEDGTTCCKTKEGGWACCPLPEAVCCEDMLHCCPKGKKCNLVAETCDDDTCSVPWVQKVPTIPRQDAQVGNVTCDSTYSCPDGSTCCKTTTGEWACCPLPEAVCCEDHEHCCPTGTTCDLAEQTCNGASGSTPMKQKIPAFATAAPTTVAPMTQDQATSSKQDEKKEPETEEVTKAENNDDDDDEENKEVGSIQCDPHTSCPQSATCCFMTSSQKWGCCPLPRAVCCTDGIHCCPSNYKCEGTTCIRGDVAISAYTKLPATTSIKADPSLLVKELETSVICGDGVTECPSGNTCCKSASGSWGCCPLPQAVCCTDGIHCCPSNYKCEGTTCIRGDVAIPAYTKLPATTSIKADPSLLVKELVTSVICGDGVTECPSGNTCCKSASGSWGCCPLPQAVCCTDGIHCCPSNYKCEGTTCIRGDVAIPAYTKLPATTSIKADPSLLVKELVTNIICGDGVTECPSGNTCCETGSGVWGCCPLPQAVCCSNMLHCCPYGYTCTDTGHCIRESRLHWQNWQLTRANKKRAPLL